jgi:hypothetical protein
MKLLDIFSRHPRGDISAHADGELAPDRLAALDAHLTGCERCRTELADLLAVRDALQELPQVAAPRSFTLTPAMTQREAQPVTSRTTPSFVAMRVAGAGFAAVLALVVMLDAGGIVDDNGSRSSDDSSTALFEADASGAADATTTTEDNRFAPMNPASDGDLGSNSGGSAAGGVSGDAEPPETFEDAQGVGGGPASGDDVSPAPAPAPAPGDGEAATLASEDDSVSYLLVIEIGLATVAVLAIGGSFVMRHRAEND